MIKRFEKGSDPRAPTVNAIERALISAGVVLIDDGAASPAGAAMTIIETLRRKLGREPSHQELREQTRFGKIEIDLAVLKWVGALNIAATLALLALSVSHHQMSN